MDLDFVSVHKLAKKKELGQYPAILTSHLVNNPYILPAQRSQSQCRIRFSLSAHYSCMMRSLLNGHRINRNIRTAYNSQRTPKKHWRAIKSMDGQHWRREWIGFRILTDLAFKSTRIVDFCGKLNGFAEFENTVERGLWIVNSRLCLSCTMSGSWALKWRNLNHKSFFSLGWYVNEFIQIISFFERSSISDPVRLLFELYWDIIIKLLPSLLPVWN